MSRHNQPRYMRRAEQRVEKKSTNPKGQLKHLEDETERAVREEQKRLRAQRQIPAEKARQGRLVDRPAVPHHDEEQVAEVDA